MDSLFLKNQACVGPHLAQPPLCFSHDHSDPTGGLPLDEPAVAIKADSAVDSGPLACTAYMESPISSGRDNMAPSARPMVPAPLATRWEPSSLPERVLNKISEARASSVRPSTP